MLSFVACVERGPLESQALLLTRSVRRFAGRFADAPILFCAPRVGFHPRAETIATLRDLGATVVDEPLNSEFAQYAIGNKIFACAHAEKHASTDLVVFVDTDTVFTSEPAELVLADGIDAAARPVDRKNRGSAGPDDRHEAYWMRMYELLGVRGQPMVSTTVDHERIRAYFNAGLVVARRAAGVFAEWEALFRELMAAGHVPANGNLNNMDQFALAAVFSRRFDRVAELDDRYNYPLGKRPLLAAASGRRQLSELRHVHYHRWFHRPDFLNLTRPMLDPKDPVVQWLKPSLPLEPTIDDPVRYVESHVRSPFFVVGTGRCGTTMLRNLLREHPDVAIPRETHWLPLLHQAFGTRAVPVAAILELVDRVGMAKGRTPFERIMREYRLDGDVVREQLQGELGTRPITVAQFQEAFYARVAPEGRTVFGDKTPDYGLCMRELYERWPQARFIHISRDGRDVALSMSKVLSFRILAALGETRWWPIALDRQYERGFSGAEGELSLAMFFELWQRRFEATCEEANRLPAGQCFDLRYEELLTNPRDVLRELHDFLALPGDREWIDDAVALIRRDNRTRNAQSPERAALGVQFAGELTALGFEP